MTNYAKFLLILKQSSFIVMFICMVASLVISNPVYAQISEFKLTASDGDVGDMFGVSVSISGNNAIVGARRDNDAGSQSGSAYLFVRDGENWAEQAKLTASDAEAGDFFGYSVSISGDYAIVGSFGDDDDGFNSGSAYVFKRDGTSWAEQTKLTASDAEAGDNFGHSVSISGDNVIVGSPEGNGRGSAYLFVRGGEIWAEQAKLVASDADLPDFFGFSVSISGGTAIVGAFGDEDLEILNGSAYVFTSVQTAQEAAQDVIGQIETLLADALLNEGQGKSLTRKLKSAIRKLDQEQEKVAVNILNAFINQVNSLINAGVLSAADGDPLISAVQNIVDSLSDGFAKRTLVSNNANPDSYVLHSNYPNPFNPETRISFVLPEAVQTRLIIYNQMGREIARLVNDYLEAGNHRVTWNASNVASGIYFYRLQAGDFVQTRKMIYLK